MSVPPLAGIKTVAYGEIGPKAAPKLQLVTDQSIWPCAVRSIELCRLRRSDRRHPSLPKRQRAHARIRLVLGYVDAHDNKIILPADQRRRLARDLRLANDLAPVNNTHA